MPKNKGLRIELGLQPYREKYLHSNFKADKLDGGRIEYVRLLSIVAVFILLIACINFMNLAYQTSQGGRRPQGGRRSALGVNGPVCG